MHLVVFDIDGTLTDTNLVDGQCYWRAVSEVFGLSQEQPDWSDFRHVTDVGIAAELCLRHFRRPPRRAEIESISRRLTGLLELALGRKDPSELQIPGASEILSVLGKSSDFAVALATGGFRRSAELKLRRASLPLTWSLASSNDASAREQILRIAAKLAAEKDATQFARFTYIGDGVWDAKAARELGWRFIGIGSGEQANRLRQAGVEIVVPDYRRTEAFVRLLLDQGGTQRL
jgi:phosphoglycolate phosphatase-like HAD superfamily hydrolase